MFQGALRVYPWDAPRCPTTPTTGVGASTPASPASCGLRLANFVIGNDWCAWQESNLLPLAPQASALSGELQAQGQALVQFRRGSIAAVAPFSTVTSTLLATTSATNTEWRQQANATGGRL